MNLISSRVGLSVLAIGLLSALPIFAQDYPNKPIKIIAPFPPGTGPDANTREIAQELTKVLGQSVVVENRPGASTMIGMEVGAKATPTATHWSWVQQHQCRWFPIHTAVRCLIKLNEIMCPSVSLGF